MIRILSKFDWHHVSLIVDETEAFNRLIRRSLESVFREESEREAGYRTQLDVQAFSYRNSDGSIIANKTIDFGKILQSSARVARSEFTPVIRGFRLWSISLIAVI